MVVTREPAVQCCQRKQVVFLVSSHIGINDNFVTAQKNWFVAQKYALLDPKGLIWDNLGPNMANNWFADQLIGSADWVSRVQPSTAKFSQVQPRTAKNSQERPKAKYSQVQPGTAKYSMVQHGTAKYSHVEPSTAKLSQVEPSTA